ncbi:uncharacterized protein LOC110183141 isoform X2 [Drosophila serrata]|uniref:uncharacterized protein LOC110183141 isoform X2 n=1 Tax=Drosophila serrata TaxID=7274 RepID=UPI000A1D3390|nr:uncharacterized protein LOC110183141 isoform X2 [Drosophila serrata]
MKLLAFLILSLYIVCVSTQKIERCVRYCTINYRPVCATNGLCIYEFKNQCLMDNNNCDNVKNKKPVFKSVPLALCYKPDNPCHPEDIFSE